MLKIDYKDVRSIHEQIEDGIKELIIKKIFSENEQLPSVRELSISTVAVAVLCITVLCDSVFCVTVLCA